MTGQACTAAGRGQAGPPPTWPPPRGFPFLSSQALPGLSSLRAAELAGPRLAVVPGSARGPCSWPRTASGCRKRPRGLGSWGYSTLSPGTFWSLKSITTSPALPGRPCPKASSLDSPGQQQCRPVHRWDPSVPLAPRWPMDRNPAPGRGAERLQCPGLAPDQSRAHACCPPAPRLLHSSGQAVLAKGRPREPEAHDVESGRRTGNTTGQGPGPGAGREGAAGPRVPTLELTGPALRRTLRTARICPRWRLLCGLGSPGQRTGALQTALQPRQGAVQAPRLPPPSPAWDTDTHMHTHARPLGLGPATLPCCVPSPQIPGHRPYG